MRAILWDMDGTLVDTEPMWGRATYAMSVEMGRDLTPEIRETTVGGIAENTVRTCAEWSGLHLDGTDPEHTLQYWVDRLHTLVSDLFSTELPLRPGIAELLAEGHRIAPMMVVTNTYRRLTDRALASIGADLFHSAVCGDEVSVGKPAPEPYLTAATRLGLSPDDCLAVEDSTTGMRSAVSAGCRVLAVPSPANPVPPGAVDIARLYPGRRDLGGLTAADLDDAWGRIGAASTDVPQ